MQSNGLLSKRAQPTQQDLVFRTDREKFISRFRALSVVWPVVDFPKTISTVQAYRAPINVNAQQNSSDHQRPLRTREQYSYRHNIRILEHNTPDESPNSDA